MEGTTPRTGADSPSPTRPELHLFLFWVAALFNVAIEDNKIENMLMNSRKTTHTMCYYYSQFEISYIIFNQPLETFAIVLSKCDDELTQILLLRGIVTNQKALS